MDTVKITGSEYGALSVLVGRKLANAIVELKLGYVGTTHISLAEFFAPEGYEVVKKK